MASHPGIGSEPEFESPYKPPPGFPDLIADADTETGYKYSAVVGGQVFRIRRADPKAIATFVSAQSQFNSNKEQRLKQLLLFVHRHTHPDDVARAMIRMVEGTFCIIELDELTTEIAKAGTARPTKPLSPWQRRRPHIGVRYGRA